MDFLTQCVLEAQCQQVQKVIRQIHRQEVYKQILKGTGKYIPSSTNTTAVPERVRGKRTTESG